MSLNNGKSDFLLAGELANKAGVSTDTLRHYERKGVLVRPRRAANGYRLYPADALARVLLVQRALAVGFTLDELAKILAERDKGNAPCQQVRSLAVAKLAQLNERLLEMQTLRDELSDIVCDWDKRLSKGEIGTPANLLESLAASPENNRQNSAKPLANNFSKKNQK